MKEPQLDRLEDFVSGVSQLLNRTGEEAQILREASGLLGRLIAVDDWLPDDYAAPDPVRYRQYLLYRDPEARFSVVSFVWGPGQATPVHDHTVWGLIGVLRGAELSQSYRAEGGALRPHGPVHRLSAGEVEAVSPTVGDVHRVTNALTNQVSISIHLYGADIGAVRRSTYDEAGAKKPFISGYSDAPPLNLSSFGSA